MPDSNSKLKAAVEDYLNGVRKIRASGVGTAETSYYLPLGNLLPPQDLGESQMIETGIP